MSQHHRHTSTQQHQTATTRKWSVAAVGLVAALVYANTLLGDFTFDDNFALISNADVTSGAVPTRDLFKHDFWGQDITSSQSHKSYRPFTVLAFRLTHRAWGLLSAAAPSMTQLLPRPAPLQAAHEGDGRAERPPGLHPFPFHVLCVVMHAVASMLVLALSQHLVALKEDCCSSSSTPAASASTASNGCSGSAAAWLSSVRGKGPLRWQQLLMWRHQPQLWLLPSSPRGQTQAFLAGLMFAIHPIHTEAVAGIVGCAELISAALSCPALLCYFMAVDGRYAAAQLLRLLSEQQDAQHTQQASRQQGKRPAPPRTASAWRHNKAASPPSVAATTTTTTTTRQETGGLEAAADALQHWLLVLAAAGLALAAALSKEIGITVVGTMLLYDALLAPRIIIRQGLVTGTASSSSGRVQLQQQQQQREQQRLQAACRRQLLRMLLVVATAVGYVKLRQWVAVQQLVNIYRKVENPIPFAGSPLTRALSTGYLHARYAWLLLMPLHLSADWSFDCIPLVQHLADWRNLATLALYCYLAHAAWSAQPLGLLRQLWTVVRLALGQPLPPQSQPQQSQPAASRPVVAAGSSSPSSLSRWRLMVLVGLVVAPFFPASNVLFYVGTFIGERLLYSPSIGFCLLAADLLVAVLLPAAWGLQPQEPQRASGSSSSSIGTSKQQQQQKKEEEVSQACGSSSSSSSWRFLVVSVLLLWAYTGRTLLRNQDWWDDERLFLSALRVCPDSAKVQQNNGVLQRRFQNYAAALQHFRRAQEIEPGYCEPTYWRGLTTFNMGADPLAGLATMKASLSCKYTAAEALQALNKVFVALMEAGRGKDPGPMLEWAGLLASPHVLRVADACATAEDAALGAALGGEGAKFVGQAVDVCLKGIQEWEQAQPQDDTLAALTKRRLAGDFNATLLAQCVTLRRAVYKKMAAQPVASPAVRRAVYRYISHVDEHTPACRTLAGGGPMPVVEGGGGHAAAAAAAATPLPSSHQKLLHKVQAADPEDAWLQHEWGATLLALGASTHLKEAALHLDVSAAIFAKASQDLQQQAGRSQGSTVSSDGPLMLHLTQLDGKTPLTPLSALQAALRPLQLLRGAAAAMAPAQACDVLQRLCHLRLMLLQAQQQAALAAAAGVKTAEAEAAMAAARLCMAELAGRPGCERQAAQLQAMVRTHPPPA